MKKKFAVVVCIMLMFVLSAGVAVAGAGGKMFVIVDRGIEKSMNDGEVRNLNQVGEWMEADLVKLLKKAGFEAEIARDASELKAGEGSHLLKVTIKDYNPGNKAARMIVGFGAGATSMKTHYELTGGDPSPVLSDDLDVGSSRDWRNVVRKLDEQTIAAVKKKLF